MYYLQLIRMWAIGEFVIMNCVANILDIVGNAAAVVLATIAKSNMKIQASSNLFECK